MTTRLIRKKRWDKSGVSEVVATILTLTITVVLFSTIIVMVDQFPPPGDKIYNEFSASIDWIAPIEGGGAYIRITNTGGQVMTGNWTKIIISINSTTYTLDTKGTLGNRTYGVGRAATGHMGVDNDDNDWDTGEIWVLKNDTGIYHNSDVGVLILDTFKNIVAWTATILGNEPEFGPVITDIWVDSNLGTLRRDPVEFGMPFYAFAEVSDSDGDLDETSIIADLSSIDPAYAAVQLNSTGDGKFQSEEMVGPRLGDVPVGYHLAVVYAEDTAGHHSSATARIPVGQDIGDQPNLVIYGRDITPSSRNPVNGQDIMVTVTVMNYGGSCTGILSFYDEVGNISTLINNMSYNFTIAESPSQYKKTITFTVKGGGPHRINVSAYPIGVNDFNTSNNYNYTDINVMPTILLVDDDARMADGTPYDTVSYMKAALDSGDFYYKYYNVNPGNDGPHYQFGEMALKKFDIVIWMCGYENSGTLTLTDQDNLEMFLTDYNGNQTNGGSLWLIGQNVLDDLAPSGGIAQSFFTSTLKVDAPLPAAPTDPGPTNPLRGVAGNPISDDWNSSSSYIPIVERIPGQGHSYEIEPNVTSGANTTFIAADSSADAINYEDVISGERLVFFPWEFSRIERNSDQTQVAFRVIMWLGNIQMKFGRDLAISEQTTVPTYVFFNDYVNVTAAIRNNGGEVEDDVEAVLVVDGEPMLDTHFKDNITVEGMGGTTMIYTLWKAESLGLHVLKWLVDPQNHIGETNEHNNMVSSYVTTGEVFVKFRILVVDDDGSANNNNNISTGFHNETKYLTDALARLGYEYESPNGTNTTYVVNLGQSGPTSDLLRDYSAVFWVTGSDVNGIIGGTDNETLKEYLLNYDGRLWLMGENLGISGLGLTSVLGIQSLTPNVGLSGRLRGVDNSSLSHGMDIPVIGSTGVDVLMPNIGIGAEGAFYQDYTTGSYCAVLYDEGNYQSLAFALNLSMLYGSEPGLISGDNAVDEITYLALHWFGKPETRKEARITTQDLFISDTHPIIGGAYILRAKVHNVGSQSTNLLVRFMDGNVQIGADSISIEPDQSTSAEVIWRPLFAGNRTIRFLIDPIAEVPEIFEWFNNNVSLNLYVYFFWDDMESGTSKWSHESTIMNINGEGPLDGYSAYNVSTDVISEWDWGMSVGVENSTVTAQSYPNSFYMEEPSGQIFMQADVLISFVIDTSASMSERDSDDDPNKTWLDVAKDSTKILLDELSDDSVCVSIWDFSSQKARRWWGPDDAPLPYTSANYDTNIVDPPLRLGDTRGGLPAREYLRLQIDAMDSPNGQTILWDGIGGAYEDIDWWKQLYLNLTPAVVVLGDGADNQASDQSGFANNGAEGGSGIWCPWDDVADGMQTYGSSTGANKPCHYGKYSDWLNPSLSAHWIETGEQGGSVDHDRVGVLYSDFMIFTVGLGLEHHSEPYDQPSTSTYPGDLDYDSVNVLYTGTDGPFYGNYPEVYWESGNLEYNFWRIANTSGAEYFYAETADDLAGILSQIGILLASGGINQTRAGGVPEPSQTANYDKAAVTVSLNLTNLASAKLSFWQKYNMLAGGHGGFLQVGYKDGINEGPDGWAWGYVIPGNAYTGNLKYDEYLYDSFGHRVFWCWNGLSGGGEFTWDHVEVDLLRFVDVSYRDEVRVKFNYTQFGGGSGVGWFLDDVKLTVSRLDSILPVDTTQDIWNLTTSQAHSGAYCWSNVDPVTGYMKTGIDNSLMTAPIDLTNAKTAYLSSYFKFNINYAGGSPPDGFRVEVTKDGGLTWTAINLGVRSSWGVSGTGFDNGDGKIDGKAYTGLPDSGNPAEAAIYGYWVEAETLSRLNVDLSSWRGNQIFLRFRVVTNNLPDAVYAHYEDSGVGFGGFYVDDVMVTGETIFG